jgi:branched-subunit amino acid ABC-type transport system permease component
MVFGILRMTNFAHGDMMMVGAFATMLLVLAGLPFGWAVVGGIVVGAAAGVLVERIAYRPVRGAPDVTLLLTSLAVTYILENLGGHAWLPGRHRLDLLPPRRAGAGQDGLDHRGQGPEADAGRRGHAEMGPEAVERQDPHPSSFPRPLDGGGLGWGGALATGRSACPPSLTPARQGNRI